jgi:hypothetical protein
VSVAFEELKLERVGNGRLAGRGQACMPDAHGFVSVKVSACRAVGRKVLPADVSGRLDLVAIGRSFLPTRVATGQGSTLPALCGPSASRDNWPCEFFDCAIRASLSLLHRQSYRAQTQRAQSSPGPAVTTEISVMIAAGLRSQFSASARPLSSRCNISTRYPHYPHDVTFGHQVASR